MILDYPSEKLTEQEHTVPASPDYAWIDSIFSDGVSLRFGDGMPATQNHYKVNTSSTFAKGDFVHVRKISGEYLVICPVGNPRME